MGAGTVKAVKKDATSAKRSSTMNIDRKHASEAIALLVAASLALPAAITAQQGAPHHGRDMSGMTMGMGQESQMQMMQMRDMMGTMGMRAGTSPMMILRHKEALGLTAEQVEKLDAVQERLAERRAAHMERMRALHEELSEQAAEAEVDLDAYESTLRSMADERVAWHLAMARSGQEAREALTAEQRDKLRVGMRFVRGAMSRMMQGRTMMGGQMGRMGPGMPSMRSGMACPLLEDSDGR